MKNLSKCFFLFKQFSLPEYYRNLAIFYNYEYIEMYEKIGLAGRFRW